MGWIHILQYGLQVGYSRGSQLVTICQTASDKIDKGDRRETVIVDFSKMFDLELKNEFIKDCNLRAGINEKFSRSVKIMSPRGLFQGSVI